MDKFKLALLQMDCELGNVEKNVADAERMIREAHAGGAQFICLPEAFNTGYYYQKIREMRALAEPLTGPTVTRLRSLAGELGVFIVAPIIQAVGHESARNTAVLLGDDGAIVGTHSKTHPVGDEAVYFERGTDYRVFDTKYGKIGILICYDICFPETARLMALSGAEMLLVPIACRHLSFFRDWTIKIMMARALDNVVFVAGACMTGNSLPDSPFTGSSMVIDPTGAVLSMAGEQEVTIVYQDIDMSRIPVERTVNTVLTDRHPEDYGPICKS